VQGQHRVFALAGRPRFLGNTFSLLSLAARVLPKSAGR
jgi:hypothetical protein